MLSKRPVLRFTAALFFLLKLFSSHIYCNLGNKNTLPNDKPEAKFDVN